MLSCLPPNPFSSLRPSFMDATLCCKSFLQKDTDKEHKMCLNFLFLCVVLFYRSEWLQRKVWWSCLEAQYQVSTMGQFFKNISLFESLSSIFKHHCMLHVLFQSCCIERILHRHKINTSNLNKLLLQIIIK